MNDLIKEFNYVCKILNEKLEIVPILYGSLGLEQIVDEDLNPEDIDILIPNEYFNEKWELLRSLIEKIGYEINDLHEHEFAKRNIKIAFANENILMDDLSICPGKLNVKETEWIKYSVLTLFDYLKAYKYSVKDGYRRNKSNGKDLVKIKIIEEAIAGNIKKGIKNE